MSPADPIKLRYNIVPTNTTHLHILSWNINGFRNLLNLDSELENSLIAADVLCFVETWQSNTIAEVPKFLNNHNIIFCSEATRQKDRGRSSGGLLIMIKKQPKI